MGKAQSAASGNCSKETGFPGRRALALAMLLAAAGLASGCTTGAKDTCSDVSGKICGRLAECGFLDTTFASDAECARSFDGLFELEASDDAACRLTWSEAEALECAAFRDYFQL